MHYGGVACDMEAIGSLRDDGGGPWSRTPHTDSSVDSMGRPLGRFGAFGAFSFHHTKNISCHEGGALVVNDSSACSTR